MKKIICLLIISVLIISLAACSGDKSAESSSSVATTDSPKSDPTIVTNDGTRTDNQTDAPKTEGVDVDLTTMSATMVYSEVLNMQQKPDEYMGKIVKMKGPFNVTETEDNRYYACVIKDATACCTTGIEFVWAGDHTYPDDYPEKDQEITVIGTFNVYSEGNSKYLQLKNAEVEF